MNLTQFNHIVQSGEKHIVVMSASWCAPCKTLKKTIQTILEKLPALKKYIHVCDIEEAEDIVEKFNITAVPTVFYIENKNTQEKKGIQSEKNILDFLNH